MRKTPSSACAGALLLRRPDLLEPQLRALYRAAKAGQAGNEGELSIMFPMITSVAEVITLKAHCERVRAAFDAPPVPLGIMIEVPAAAGMADILAAHVDFFSIGTNDLTQYTLAIDRQNPELAAEADSLHPAVLRLIDQTVKGAQAHGRWVGVCGGIAGIPSAQRCSPAWGRRAVDDAARHPGGESQAARREPEGLCRPSPAGAGARRGGRGARARRGDA